MAPKTNNTTASRSESLGAKIRQLRLKRGMGQEQLAIEASVDQSALSKFERGKRSSGFSEAALERMANSLGTTLDELMSQTIDA